MLRQGLGAGMVEARAVCLQLCMRQSCDSVLCCTLFGSLFTNAIHGHCSRTLFMGTIHKKKKEKKRPLKIRVSQTKISDGQ